jgi:hypothetical protein
VAEQTYDDRYETLVKDQDEASIRLLEDLRRQLDELEQYRQECLLDGDMEMMVIDDDEYDEEYVNEGIEGFTVDYSEESEGEAELVDGDGDEDELVGGDKDVDVFGPLVKAETQNLDVPMPTLRPQKSVKFNKGGAFHAHQFARSIGRGALLRPSLLDMDFSYNDEQSK